LSQGRVIFNQQNLKGFCKKAEAEYNLLERITLKAFKRIEFVAKQRQVFLTLPQIALLVSKFDQILRGIAVDLMLRKGV
jgi:hypothetical protein